VDLARRLADAVATLGRDRVLVGIDGPDAAGKTTLAERLAGMLPGVVLRVSADDFLQPRDVRYARGELSPEGYFRDSLDLPRLIEEQIRPFRDGEPVVGGTAIPRRAVLVADGIFLHRPELAPFWTLSVYLAVSEAQTLARAHVRDRALFGSAEEVERRYRARYLPGQALYRRNVDPERVAHVLVDNDDVTTPRILRWSLPATA
jgi:uridine kinase